MKLKSFALILLSLFTVGVYGQNDYYYYKGKKIALEIDRSQIDIITESNVNIETIRSLGVRNIEFKNGDSPKEQLKRATLELEPNLSKENFSQRIKSLTSIAGVQNYSLYVKRKNAPSIGTSNIFYVKLKEENDLELLEQVANQKNVSIVHQNKFMPQWYKLSLKPNATKTTIEISNEFFETGLFAAIDPAFMFHFTKNSTNDPDFDQLWGLNNSQNPDVDINILDAWTITEGNGIKVAVFDSGIDKNHIDLANNISSLSYDAENSTSPSINGTSYHGTHVAGTIAAVKNNEEDIVGVAPQSEIISVSHSFEINPDFSEQLADGINWAWDEGGADVINNSWGDAGGYYYNDMYSQILDNAINNALTEGRDGLGTIVIFAAGNSDLPVINYPANANDNILSVGAITSSGSKWFDSSYGSKLDVVAPGQYILSTAPNNTTLYDSGTSMAAPHATGIVALILSVNPNLTYEEVNDIVESTAQKVNDTTYNYSIDPNRPNGTWNEQMGYGLVDAYAAVQAAQQFEILSGPDRVCNSPNSTFTVQNGGHSIQWQVSSNLQIVSSNDSNITVKATSSNGSGPGYVRAIAPIRTIQKDIQVGTPKPSGFNYVFVEPQLGKILASVADLQNGAAYKWYVNGVEYTGPDSNSHSVSIPIGRNDCTTRDYYIGVKAVTSCGTSSEYYELHDNPCYVGPYYYSYSPNPVTNTLTIERYNGNFSKENSLNDEASTTHYFKLYDFNGNLVKLGTLSDRTIIDVSKLEKGRFVLKIEIEENIEETHHIIIN